MVFARFGFSWNFRLSYPRLRQALSRYQQYFMNEIQIKEYIEFNNVKEILSNSFKSIIENNTCEDLDIDNKNISIDLDNIEYDSKKNPLITFKCKIINQDKTIGFYSIVFEQTGKIIDDFFVIF